MAEHCRSPELVEGGNRRRARDRAARRRSAAGCRNRATATPGSTRSQKPAFMPPGWTFGVVWPILYALLGISVAMILAEPPRRGGRPR